MRTLTIALVACIALAIVAFASSGGSAVLRCPAGSALAFVAIRPDPQFLVGTIPSGFTSDAGYFSRRYNCRGLSALVRRIDLGIYDVRFPGLDPRAVIATATSDEGVTASALPLGDGIVRVALRGPLVGGDVMARRDVPFSVVVY